MLTLQINVGVLVVATSSLPSGNQGTAYVSQLSATGGVPPYNWAVGSSTPLPAGLTLSSSGLLSGTPGAASSATYGFTVTDSAKNTATAGLKLVVNPATGTVPDGQYSFVFAGTAPEGTPVSPNAVAINGTFAITSGVVTSGFFDENTNTNPALVEQPITGGSLSDGANRLGQLVLTTPSGTMTFALAAPASFAAGGAIRMIEFDDATGAGSRGAGVLKGALANAAAAAIGGNFAFLLSGTDIRQRQQALICSFQTNGAGAITNGNANSNQEGTPEVFNSLTGSYAVDANGRGVLKVRLGGVTFSFSFYQVSPGEWLTISLDPATLNSPLVSGRVLQQTGAPFSTASLPTTGVVELSGLAPTSTGTTPDITVGLETSDGHGNVAFTFDNFTGSLTSGESASAVFAVDSVTGRALASSSSNAAFAPIVYIIDSSRAFVLDSDTAASSGLVELQSGSPFTNASFSGSYLGGSLPLVDTSVLNEAGLVVADGGGNLELTTDRSTPDGLQLYYTVTGTYAVDSRGRAVVTAADGVSRIFYLVSPDKIAYLSGDGGGYLGSFEQ